MQAFLIIIAVCLLAIGLRLLWKRALHKAMIRLPSANAGSDQEKNFYTITEAANDGILVNQAGKHVYTNQAIADMLGYSQAELLGTTLLDVVHPDEQDRVQQRFKNRLKGIDEPSQYETVFVNRHGDKIPVELTATITRWQGAQAGLAIVRDITDRKLIEQTLRDSEKRYRSLIENSPHAIIMLDADIDQFVEANEQATGLFRYSKDELFKRQVLDLSPPRQPNGQPSAQEWQQRCDKVIHGVPQTFEWTFMDRKQVTIPCEVRLSRMPFPNRRLINGSIIDISHRKQIESALAASELRLTSFFQAAFEILLFHDNGIILDVNENIRQMTGYSRDEIIGKNLLDFVAAESRQTVIQNMQNAVDGPYEVEVDCKDGSTFTAIIRAKTINLDNTTQRVVSISDHTAHKKMESDLHHAGQQVHAILDNMLDTFYRTDEQGRLIMLSPSVYNLFGYHPEEVLGKEIASFYIESDGRDKFLAALVENNGAVCAYEAPMRHRDGHTIWVSTNARLIQDNNGQILGVEGTTRDISEQRKIHEDLQHARDNLEQRVQQRTKELSNKVIELEELQEELQISEKRFRTLFDRAADIFLLHDVEGQLLDVNLQTCSSLGYSKEELLQLTVDDIDIGLNPVPVRQLAKQLTNGETFRIDTTLKRKDGSSFPVEVSLALLENAGDPLFLALIRDITERKYAELQILAAKEEAEYASQAKTEFLSRMSHELRTPMNAIIGFGELLESDPHHPLSENQHDNISEILNAARHLLDLINEILDLARIESGRITVSMAHLQLADLVNECITLIQPMATEKNIEIHNQIKSCASSRIEADNTRLKQVLLNLLSNAIKYNKQNGSIHLECVKIAENTLRLSVTDTGIGLNQEQLKQLFQPFERLAADQQGIEGSGIGLVISKHLIELMGGRIGVESKPGEGSHFWLELPLSTELATVSQDNANLSNLAP